MQFGNRHDLVPGFVERRADQIVHRRVDDDEVLGVGRLHMNDPGDQDAGIAGDHPSRLEDQPDAEVAEDGLDDCRILVGMRRNIVGAAIGHPEAAAEIDMADVVALLAQAHHKLGQKLVGLLVGPKRGDLAADMHVDAGHLDARQFGGAGIDRLGIEIGYAELVRRPVPVVIFSWVPASTSGLMRIDTTARLPSARPPSSTAQAPTGTPR
jgi:hypothetical protein